MIADSMRLAIQGHIVLRKAHGTNFRVISMHEQIWNIGGIPEFVDGEACQTRIQVAAHHEDVLE